MARLVSLVLFFLVGMVQGRLVSLHYSSLDLNDQLISDGVRDKHETRQDFPVVLSSSKCEPMYGFIPCADNIGGYIFQIVLFMYLMDVGEKLVTTASNKLFAILGTGVFGASILRILKVLPRIVMMIASGIFATKEGAQNQVFFGVRVNAGATVFSLTILWGLCVMFGKKQKREDPICGCPASVPSLASKCSDHLKDSHISTDDLTRTTAGLMLLSLAPYVFVEFVNAFKSPPGKRIVVLFGLIISFIFLLSYFTYQIRNPKIQERSLKYSKIENLVRLDGRPSTTERTRNMFHAYDKDEDGKMSEDELDDLLKAFMSEDKQRLETVKKIMKDLDKDGDNKVDEEDIIEGLPKWIPSDKQTPSETSPIINKPERQGDGHAGNKILTWDFLQCVFQVILAIVILTLSAQPVMNNVIQLSEAMGVSTFFISFVVLPFVINGRMAILALIFPAKAASLNFSEIYGGVTMNNLTGILTLLAVVYGRDLTWCYSAEVLVVAVISLIIGLLAYLCSIYRKWTIYFAFFLYFFSLALFYVLQEFVGWD